MEDLVRFLTLVNDAIGTSRVACVCETLCGWVLHDIEVSIL